jgi:uncharacterized oligopeptide transporter (OPT) family protein
MPHSGKTVSLLDWLFNSSGWYSGGKLMVPYKYDNLMYTHIDFALSPMMFATGWFMKARSAFLVAAGSLLTWVVAVPAAMLLNVEVYVPKIDTYKGIMDAYFSGVYPSIPLAAYKEVAVPIAIGAILGGGITALLKMSKVFVSCFKDMMSARTSEKKDYIGGKGWYEWPYSHIGISAAIMLLGLPLILMISGYAWPQSIATSIVLFILTLFLSAIAVKVMGEIRTTPVSGTSFIMMMALAGVLSLLGTEPKMLVVMTLFGTALFGTACSLAADVVSDFKTAIYCGTRPYYQMKGEIIGMVPGAAAAIIGTTILSFGLANGTLDLAAPQANAFAKFSQALVGGQAPYMLMGIGFAIGVVADLLTGMGTSFGLGMYFPLSTSLTILLGGIARTLWEKNSLQKNAKKYNWSEKEKTLKLIDTFMASTGLIVGEALVGTIIGLYLVIPMMFGGGK